MKRPIFTDNRGRPYFEDARHDLRDHRGQLIGDVEAANIRAILRLLEACKATRSKIPASAKPRLQAAIAKRLHSMGDGTREPE